MREESAAELTIEDAVILDIQARAGESVAGWADVREDDPLGAPVLYPAWRPSPARSHQLDTETIRLGLRRIMLTLAGDIPSVTPQARLAVAKAYHARDASGLTHAQINEVIQVALFGKVIYR